MTREILFYSDFPFGYHNPEAEARMARFADRGYRVHYVEQLGIRNPHVRHLARFARGLGGTSRTGPQPPFEVVSPKLLPPRRAPLVGALNRRWLARQLLSRVGDPAATIFWIRFPTPELVPLVEGTRWRVVVYEEVDAHHEAPGVSERLLAMMAAAERRILARAGVVFAASEPLRARLSAMHPNVAFSPAAAVDLDAYARAAPRRLATGRVACYTGSFDSRLDGDLLAGVAKRLPSWTFILAGPMGSAWRRLLELPNVRSMGRLPLEEVPGVVAGADACLMPYRVDAFGDALFPLKLVEYLAAGKPVVSTPIRAARDFGELVELGANADEFAAALAAAVEDDSEERRRGRIRRVESFSLDRRLDEMEGAIAAAARNGPAATASR